MVGDHFVKFTLATCCQWQCSNPVHDFWCVLHQFIVRWLFHIQWYGLFPYTTVVRARYISAFWFGVFSVLSCSLCLYAIHTMLYYTAPLGCCTKVLFVSQCTQYRPINSTQMHCLVDILCYTDSDYEVGTTLIAGILYHIPYIWKYGGRVFGWVP